ncbi:hypothetical protein [Desulfosporosinus sp. I2]|uniref:hypothetical protein n=1 Tax=Desulfosporosinus sp. I2 TaxID=1617025 RepID=UPI0012E09CDD|nr:hypothetical protein [Desulfosporosinus sp. I2]
MHIRCIGKATFLAVDSGKPHKRERHDHSVGMRAITPGFESACCGLNGDDGERDTQ